MRDSLMNGYNLSRRRRHGGDVQEFPYLVNLFPDLYVNASGAFTTSPFQLTLASGATARVPFILPKDGMYREHFFRFDVTDGNYSCFLTDVSVALVHTSGGARVAFDDEQLAVFQGTNGGWGQVRVPYIHPREGSVIFRFKNLYPGTRAISGYLQGYKVQA